MSLLQLNCPCAGDIPSQESQVIHKFLGSVFLESVILVLCRREIPVCLFNFLLVADILKDFILFSLGGLLDLVVQSFITGVKMTILALWVWSELINWEFLSTDLADLGLDICVFCHFISVLIQ